MQKIHYGGCISKGGSVGCYRAHAHISGPYKGWICVRDHKPLPKNLLLHEQAHILTGEGHTYAWAKKLIEMGGKIGEKYKKLKGVAKAIAEI